MRITSFALAATAFVWTVVAPDPPQPTGATSYGNVQTAASAKDNNGIPALVGNVYTSDGQCYFYTSCGLSGKGWWDALQKTLKNPPATDPDRDGKAILYKYYVRQPTRLFDVPGGYLNADFVQFRLPPVPKYGRGPGYSHWSVSSRREPFGDNDYPPAYEFSYNSKAGIIISWYADRLGRDSQKRNPWSELVAQTILAQREAEGSSDPLQWVVFHDVLSPGANNLVADIAAKEFHVNPKQDTEWRRWTSDSPWFISLIGVDPVREVAWMLNDHSVALGRLNIVEIWTRGISTTPRPRAVEIYVRLGPYSPANSPEGSGQVSTAKRRRYLEA
ncbi:MAG: hypothetical protein LQ345_002218 [Seirophora villosa]|nr:MAG: hypothetical protein LQ345_002218 [Seirophora villosa]